MFKSRREKDKPPERRTLDLRERLSRISFRRHSAPAGSGERDEHDADTNPLPTRRAARPSPLVLDQLPMPVLDLVLHHLSLKELVSHAALVHKSWHALIMDEAFWRRRLAGQLPQDLVSFFNHHWRGTWPDQVSRFYNQNLVANPGFSSQQLVAAKGLGKAGSSARNCWRVQIACWESEPCTDASCLQLGMQHGCGPDMKMLQLTTPTWANPEAAQEINLLQCLMERGMSVGTASAYLDTSPPISFSVWCSCRGEQPAAWRSGYAVCVLDNGRDSGLVWRSFKVGSQLLTNNAGAYYISWAPDACLLRSCEMLPRKIISTSRGDFKRLACIFQGYPKGVRRAHVLLKGFDPSHVFAHGGKEAKACKPQVSFISPCLKFRLPDV